MWFQCTRLLGKIGHVVTCTNYNVHLPWKCFICKIVSSFTTTYLLYSRTVLGIVDSCSSQIQGFFYTTLKKFLPTIGFWWPNMPIIAFYTTLTYSSELYVSAGLIWKTSRDMQEQTILIGNIPLMNSLGTSIVNGIYRIVINQILQSPDIYYRSELDHNGISVWSEYAGVLNQLMY